MNNLIVRTIVSVLVFFITFVGMCLLINKKVDWITAVICAVTYGIVTYIMARKREKR